MSKVKNSLYIFQSSALHRKLQSKSEALKIMRNDLELYRTERDQFKLMAETLQMRYSALKNSVETCDFKDLRYGEGSNVGTMLNHSREKNISLNTEIENLKQKLQELQGDIKILRSKNLEMMKQQKKNESQNKCNGQDDVWNEEKSRLIAQLEKLKKKVC